MKEFENIVIGKSSIPALIITSILMIAIWAALWTAVIGFIAVKLYR